VDPRQLAQKVSADMVVFGGHCWFLADKTAAAARWFAVAFNEAPTAAAVGETVTALNDFVRTGTEGALIEPEGSRLEERLGVLLAAMRVDGSREFSTAEHQRQMSGTSTITRVAPCPGVAFDAAASTTRR
jgi:hypothetical protein